MNRIERMIPSMAAWLMLASACGDDTGGGTGGGTSSTGAELSGSTSTSSSSSGDGGTATASGGGGGTSVATSSASGDGGAATQGAGGAGGGAAPSPQECWAILDSDECYAAGCDVFHDGTDGLTVVDGVCVAEATGGRCFREEGTTTFVPAIYFRDFAGEGPEVIGLNNHHPLQGFTICNDSHVADNPACCCYQFGSAIETPELCEGITPVPSGG